MKRFNSILCLSLAIIMAILVVMAFPSKRVLAAVDNQNEIILSTDHIAVTVGNTETFTAALPQGYDGSQLSYVVADSDIINVTPIAYAGNVASFAVNYITYGSTVVAIYNVSEPSMVAYVVVNSNIIKMEIPSKLGTSKDNYCTLVSYEFVPYDYKYDNFNDYKCTLNITYKCASYEDDAYSKWGCYGYFYDADGNEIKKVHLYSSVLKKGRTYHSEFNVPVNAVRFSIEGV